MTESESAPVCQTCGLEEWLPADDEGFRFASHLRQDLGHLFVPERAGDDEARTSPAEWAAMTARIRDLAGRLPAQPALSGDEPVTSPELDAARRGAAALSDGWTPREAYETGFIEGAEQARASERAAAAERERGLRAALQRYGRHESPACARVVQERCPCGLDYALAVSGEGEGQ